MNCVSQAFLYKQAELSASTPSSHFAPTDHLLAGMSTSPPPEGGKDHIALAKEELGGDLSPATAGDETIPPIRKRPPFFRSTLFQILVVGICAFTAPGIWSAMNGLGVGGSQSPDLVNAANAM